MDSSEVLAGYAGWQGHGHGERAAAWLARLEVNRPELEAFRALATPAAPAYLATPASVRSAHGESAGGKNFPADARDALSRAREQHALNAFTFLSEHPDDHGEGFLAGVPIAVKDLMRVKGMPLTAGSNAMDAELATHDAEVVARLKRAGAVVMGLANLHEFAYGITSDNPRFGRVVNPAAPARIPGGSSGGSAAAIAAGIVRAAVGTDTAGSIRVPAACCGIVGLKPTYDAVPREGVIDLAASLDHVGPMGRRVDDCAALFAAMLGMQSVPAWTRANLSGMTVARLGGYFAQPLDAEVAAAMDQAVRALASDGARVVDRDIPAAVMAPAIQLQTIAPEATAFHADRLRARGADYSEDVRVRLEMGLFFPAHWYVKAQRLRTVLVNDIESAFGEAGAFICPTMRVPAPIVGAGQVRIGDAPFALHSAVTQLTLPFNLSGLPAISVPWMRSSDGVPIALQVVAPRGEDWRVLAIARRLEALSPWAQHEPN